MASIPQTAAELLGCPTWCNGLHDVEPADHENWFHDADGAVFELERGAGVLCVSETVKVAAGVAQRPFVQLSTHEPSGSVVLLTEHEASMLATAVLAAAARLGESPERQR